MMSQKTHTAQTAAKSGASGRPLVLQRKCGCGGSAGLAGECESCRAKKLSGLQTKLAINQPGDIYEQEADRVADQVMGSSGGHAAHGAGAAPAAVAETSGIAISRYAGGAGGGEAPASVHEVVNSPGQPLDSGARSFMESRFGHDFSHVRVHAGTRAAESARQVDAMAYTVGHNVVFDTGRYAPDTAGGKRLLAHELAHVVQQRGGGMLQRTPANKTTCPGGNLTVPGVGVIADPVGVITAAENRANTLLDAAIDELASTRARIVGGEGVGWPTISDALGAAMRVMGLDPDSETVWRGRGLNTADLLLRRLRGIRRPIGAGSFFFTCLGNGRQRLANCVASSGDLCQGADAVTCAGAFQTAFCAGFWRGSAEYQAARIIHETAHNFADFINDAGREGNAECYTRFAQILSDVPVAEHRLDLCPDA